MTMPIMANALMTAGRGVNAARATAARNDVGDRCVCVCVCVRACMRACVRACVCVCVWPPGRMDTPMAVMICLRLLSRPKRRSTLRHPRRSSSTRFDRRRGAPQESWLGVEAAAGLPKGLATLRGESKGEARRAHFEARSGNRWAIRKIFLARGGAD